jgi:transcriptional regulator with XRE-family HTH domain
MALHPLHQRPATARRPVSRTARIDARPIKAIGRLVKMRLRSNMTRYRLSQASGVDYSYLKRLETGTSRNPSRATLIALGRAMVAHSKMFTEADVDKILGEANFAPAPDPASALDRNAL